VPDHISLLVALMAQVFNEQRNLLSKARWTSAGTASNWRAKLAL
jgi:hypothetical protein